MTTRSSGAVIKTLWSDCSYDKFNTVLNDPKAVSCLTTDIPKPIFAHAICGNGIREGSESCDCGSSKVSSGPVLCCKCACISFTSFHILLRSAQIHVVMLEHASWQ